MRTEIKKLHHRLKTTMVYVTHDQVEAMTMGDRIAIIQAGIVHQIDTPAKVYESPADLFVAGFIGSPSMNFIPVVIHKEEKLYADEGYIKIPLLAKYAERLQPFINSKLIIGIRPEKIALNPIGEEYAELKVKLELSEPMGNETYLYLTTGQTNIVARSNLNLTCTNNTIISVFVDLENIYFFEPQTGRVI
jgi:multiple sugar transport system ATP-binding protein